MSIIHNFGEGTHAVQLRSLIIKLFGLDEEPNFTKILVQAT